MGCCVNLSDFTSLFFTHPVLHSGVKVARTVPVEETRKLHGATGWSADGMTQKLVRIRIIGYLYGYMIYNG
jgi:hypothetical protein